MLSNAYFLAKFRFGTAENEPCKVYPLSVYRSPRLRVAARDWRGGSERQPKPVPNPDPKRRPFGSYGDLRVDGYGRIFNVDPGGTYYRVTTAGAPVGAQIVETEIEEQEAEAAQRRHDEIIWEEINACEACMEDLCTNPHHAQMLGRRPGQG